MQSPRIRRMRADLALIGFGHVGRRFARLLDERRDVLRSRCDLECRVVAIATRTGGTLIDLSGIDAVAAAAAYESRRVLSGATAERANRPEDGIARLAASDAPLKVVVETTTLDIRTGRPAIDHIEAALSSGCHAVTANKGPVAFAYRALSMAAARAGLSFLFEGAVMDGVPVFNLVRETLPAVAVLGFRGVVNSTTNHILSALEAGEEFGPALARMQAAGIAEGDASLDVDGWDAAAKAAALANVLFDADITPHDVEREGLGPDAARRVREARARGRRLKLVVSGRPGSPPTVRLAELDTHDLLAGLDGTANALVLETDLLGEIAITQLRGSLTETAYALLTDLVTIRRRYRVPTGSPPDRIL